MFGGKNSGGLAEVKIKQNHPIVWGVTYLVLTQQYSSQAGYPKMSSHSSEISFGILVERNFLNANVVLHTASPALFWPLQEIQVSVLSK